jgi:hypothetical protein
MRREKLSNLRDRGNQEFQMDMKSYRRTRCKLSRKKPDKSARSGRKINTCCFVRVRCYDLTAAIADLPFFSFRIKIGSSKGNINIYSQGFSNCVSCGIDPSRRVDDRPPFELFAARLDLSLMYLETFCLPHSLDYVSGPWRPIFRSS